MSASNLANFWSQSYFKITFQIFCQVSTRTNSKYSWQYWIGLCKECAKYTTISRSIASPKNKTKKYSDDSLRAGNSQLDPSCKECNPYFCLAIFLGPPAWQLLSQVLRTQKETNQVAIAVPGRVKIDNQWVFKSNSRVTIQRFNSQLIFFFFLVC